MRMTIEESATLEYTCGEFTASVTIEGNKVKMVELKAKFSFHGGVNEMILKDSRRSYNLIDLQELIKYLREKHGDMMDDASWGAP